MKREVDMQFKYCERVTFIDNSVTVVIYKGNDEIQDKTSFLDILKMLVNCILMFLQSQSIKTKDI